MLMNYTVNVNVSYMTQFLRNLTVLTSAILLIQSVIQLQISNTQIQI